MSAIDILSDCRIDDLGLVQLQVLRTLYIIGLHFFIQSLRCFISSCLTIGCKPASSSHFHSIQKINCFTMLLIRHNKQHDYYLCHYLLIKKCKLKFFSNRRTELSHKHNTCIFFSMCQYDCCHIASCNNIFCYQYAREITFAYTIRY